jgi:hypothetical protein
MRFITRHCILSAMTWAAVIFVLCATPGRYIPSANWLDLLSFDKLVHLSVFLVLNSLLILIIVEKKFPLFMIFFFTALAILYGASLEWMQAHVFSERSADWKDVIANTAGCLVAVGFTKRIKNLKLTLRQAQGK